MTAITTDVLRSKRAEYVDQLDKMSIDMIALQGAIQALDELLGDDEPDALPISALPQVLGVKSVEVVDIIKGSNNANTVSA